MPPFISDISYYRRCSFLGRRDNRNVIYSVALNSGLVTFLAVDPSLHKKKNLIHFFCSHIWTLICIYHMRLHRCVAKDIHIEKA